MDSVYAGNETLLRERYPDLGFLLNFYTPVGSIFEIGHLDQIEVLYLYGMGSGEHYTALLPWLREKSERIVVILEDDSGSHRSLAAQRRS